MQTGAFIQLILTLVAIVSRLSVVLTELRATIELCWRSGFNILQVLDVSTSSLGDSRSVVVQLLTFYQSKQAQSIRPLVPEDPASITDEDAPVNVTASLPTPILDVVGEDLGSALERPPQKRPSSLEVNVAPASITAELGEIDMISNLATTSIG